MVVLKRLAIFANYFIANFIIKKPHFKIVKIPLNVFNYDAIQSISLNFFKPIDYEDIVYNIAAIKMIINRKSIDRFINKSFKALLCCDLS